MIGTANAQISQTDTAHTPLPQPVGTSELNLCNGSYGYSAVTQSYKDPSGAFLTLPIIYGAYYAPPAFPQFVDGDEITLSGLFKWRKEQIDPILDAKTAPGHFFPGCGVSAELVLRGGGCSSGLGWYNVTPSSTSPPAGSEIYPLIPADTAYLNATRTSFAPLAWDNRVPFDLSVFAWTPKSFSTGAIQSDPRYKGGEIAFALVGDPLGKCTQTKFSVYEHNVKNSGAVPWVTALIYQSTLDPTAIYLAFEDLPMSAADWHQTGSTGSSNTNDGDFNDFVFFISGLGATSACPDPACQVVSCSAGLTCAGGVCVPSSSGGAGNGSAGHGGVAHGGAGNGGGNTSQGGQSVGGDAGAGAGESGASTSDGSAGDSPLGDGGVTGGNGDTADGGMSATEMAGAGDSDRQVGSGCSCRMGSRGAAHPELLWLALTAACLARRWRRKP